MTRPTRHLRRAAHPGRRRRAAGAKGERGAALLLAIVSVALLTALAVDLAYDTQVRLRIAANARDELRAQALAQSAVNVSRLVLSFQAAIDRTASNLCSAQAAAGGAGGAPGGGAPAGGAPSACPRPQLWNLVPVSSALTHALFAEGAGGKGDAPGAAPSASAGAPAVQTVQAASLGDFEGGFQARIDDEGQKINAQLDGLLTSGVLGPQVEGLLRMMCDSKWDALFDRTDASGQRYSRADVVVNLHDWVSQDTTASALKASFPGGNCSFVVDRSPFEKAFSDKNYAYDRGSDRYRVKNSRLDSVEELHLVAGITDAWMAAFADQLTVYLPQNAQMNVNTTDPAQLLRIESAMADPSAYPKLLDPAVQAAVRKILTVTTASGFMSITPVQFAQILEGAGVKVRSEYLTQAANSPFTDRSVVYRIHGLGQAGDVTHEIDAVVSYDDRLNELAPQNLPPGATPPDIPNLGALIHWRED